MEMDIDVVDAGGSSRWCHPCVLGGAGGMGINKRTPYSIITEHLEQSS
jgi:hypothetical protein